MTRLYERDSYSDGREHGYIDGYRQGRRKGQLQGLGETIAYMREQTSDWPTLHWIAQIEAEMRKRFSK